jgi:hypothetical protein
MNRTIILTFSAGLLALAAPRSFGQASDAAAGEPAVDLAVPRIQMTLEGRWRRAWTASSATG